MTLKERRINAGWSQTFVAKRTGVTRQTVANWETGETIPTGKNLTELCELYGATAKELMEGQNCE